jgi:chromosome segregation ATPase
MKNFLQNLLIFFSLCLCALIAFQWVRETDLRKRVQALTDTVHDKSEAIQSLQGQVRRDEDEIKRLDGLKNQLTATVKSNQLDIAKLTKDLEKAEAENEKNLKQSEIYKEAFEKQKAVAEKQGADILKQNKELTGLAARYSLTISNLNLISGAISGITEKWNRMGQELQKASGAAQREMAVTNTTVMAADFNELVARWNKMQQGLAQASTNAPADTGGRP